MPAPRISTWQTCRRRGRRNIRAALHEKRLSISALGYYPNPLHPDAAHRETVIAHLKSVIVAAGQLGVGLVNTFCGGDAALTVDANWQRALAVWPEVVAHAREFGVKLCFENCPMIFSHDEWPGGHNIAYSPQVWRRILEAWGGDVGLNFDPSHLVWQMIDLERFIREFGPHILHTHAKDLMIDREGLYERGILSAGIGWQVPRMPGLGEVDWRVFFSGLYRAGYDGPVVVEHEDRRFEGSDEATSAASCWRGISCGRSYGNGAGSAVCPGASPSCHRSRGDFMEPLMREPERGFV